MGEVGDLPEAGEVAAGGLRSALDHVAGHDRAGERVVVAGRPPPPPGGGAAGQGGVRDASGHHHVGAGVQRRRDPEAAEVGVGGERLVAPAPQRRAGVEMGEVVAGGQQLRQALAEVVALHVSHGQVDAHPRQQLAGRLGQPGGVQPAGVDHDLDPARGDLGGDRFELAQEAGGVAAARMPGTDLGQHQHGDLGQVVTGHHVHRTAGDHLGQRLQPVAVEARAVGDPDRPPPGHAHTLTLPRRWRQEPRRATRLAVRP